MRSNTIPVAFQADPPGRAVDPAEKPGKKPYVAPRINFSENLEVIAGGECNKGDDGACNATS